MHKIYITAHAGAFNTEPNTIDSVKAGLAFAGADCIEVDVRFLPDGTPVLGHTSAREGAVTLAAVFERMQHCQASINLDMKELTHLDRVMQLVDTYGLQGRSFMTGLFARGCAAARGCGLPYYLNLPRLKLAKKLGAQGINISYRICHKWLVRAAHAQGLLVSVWTVDAAPAMQKMLRLGVDNITTRHPDVLAESMSHAV